MDDQRIAAARFGRIGLIRRALHLARRVQGARLVAVTTSGPDRAVAARQACGVVAGGATLAEPLEDERACRTRPTAGATT